ncbi:MAG: putative metal-binding motif-containing protein, partial [Candidatus Nanoarchaeia archaeon]
MHKRGLIILFAVIIFSVLVYALDEDGDEYCTALDGTTATGAACPSELDCNDNNPEISPGISEIAGDGIDNNCNGIIDDACTDSDNDGYNSTASANGISCGGEANVDCDDANIFINSGATELCSDEIDNDCDGLTDEADSDCTGIESSCTIDPDMTMWINCDADTINSANEGDTVYMILWTEGCDEESDVKFNIYEHSEGSDTLEDTVDVQEVFTNIIDPDTGLETDIDLWIAPWAAAYMTDDDDTYPEYYFDGEITETGGAVLSQDSGKTEDIMLSVASCDGCGIECTLNIGEMMGVNYSGSSGLIPPCQKSIDCSGVAWSECDDSTGKMARDTSLCVITGTGTVECEAQIIAMTPSERLCSSSGALTKSSGESVGECGDGICDEGEECAEDCDASSGFPWLWILIAVIVIGAATTGIIMYKKKKPVVAGAAKPGEKEVMPFTAQKDLDSVLGYIRAAKGKGYKDEQITEALKKAGWKE